MTSEVSFASVLADLSAEFGWAPDAWRRLTWRELQAWISEIGRRRREEAEAVRRAQQERDTQAAAEAFYRSQGVRR